MRGNRNQRCFSSASPRPTAAHNARASTNQISDRMDCSWEQTGQIPYKNLGRGGRNRRHRWGIRIGQKTGAGCKCPALTKVRNDFQTVQFLILLNEWTKCVMKRSAHDSKNASAKYAPVAKVG